MDYKIIFKESYIYLIKYLETAVLENIANVGIEKIRYFVLEREAHIVLKNNTILIFSLDDSMKEQLEKLVLFYLNNKKQFDNIFYIDLKFSKKIIFCPVAKQIECKKNLKDIYDFVEKKPKKIEKENKVEKNKFPKIKL